MLTKLLKYEFKATGRLFIPIFAGVIVLSLINKLFYMFKDNPFFGISYNILMTVFGALLVLMYGLTVTMMIQRFYKNLLGDEGYLMNTLPVRPSSHILSKLIVSVVWVIASFAVMMVSVFLLTVNTEIMDDILYFLSHLSAKDFWLVVEIKLLVVISTAATTLLIYTALCLGHLFNKHRVAASFGAYIGITLLLQIVFSTLEKMGLFRSFVSIIFQNKQFTPHLIGLFLTVISLVIGVAAYFTTNYLLKNKLNLE